MTQGRIVVTLQGTLDGRTQVLLETATFNVQQGQFAAPFDLQPPTTATWSAPHAVMQHGSELRHALAQHPAIAKLLDLLTQFPDPTPIYFYLQSPAAEQYYWEALYDDTQHIFLALDPRWPIARMANALATQPAPPLYMFDGRLRVAAVLSALDVPADPEWQNLLQAVAASRADGQQISLLLLVGEETLHEAIQAQIDSGALPDAEVQLLAETSDRLEAALEKFKPHILHFFCHGAVEHGARWLKIATALDWAAAKPESSLTLAIDELTALPWMRQVWLVVLNCCKGGAAGEQLHSMAQAIAARGTPAAVGMLEPIAASDAQRFSGGFYPALFRTLQQTLDAADGSTPVSIEWSMALRAARIQLRGPDPASERTWALPVLYVRRDFFHVLRLAPAPAAVPQPQPPAPTEQPKGINPPGPSGQLEAFVPLSQTLPGDMKTMQAMLLRTQEVAEFLRSLPIDAPESVRRRALALLDEEPSVPHPLRPDEFGKIGSNPILQEAP